MPLRVHCCCRTCLPPSPLQFKDRGCLGDLYGQTIALTDGEKMREAKDMVKERTASYATSISSNTKNLANKAVSSAQQPPPVTWGHALKGVVMPSHRPPPPSCLGLEPCVELPTSTATYGLIQPWPLARSSRVAWPGPSTAGHAVHTALTCP